MDFELFVIGSLVYALAFLVFAAVRRPSDAAAVESPDGHDAPIVVRRVADREFTVAVRHRTRPTS